MTFLRLFVGCSLQIMPFAFLSLYPFKTKFRFSPLKTLLMTVFLILFLSSIFAIICSYLSTCYTQNQTLFFLCNRVFMCCLLPCMLWYLYVVIESVKNKLFIFFFTLASALLITSLCSMLDANLQLDRNRNWILYSNSFLISLAIVTALVWLPFYFLLKRTDIVILEFSAQRGNNYLLLLSISTFTLLTIILIPIDYSSISNPKSWLLYFLLFLIIFLVYFTFFRLFMETQRRLYVEAQLLKGNQHLELYAKQLIRINDSVEDSRKIRHDTRHHILTIQGLLKEGNSDNVRNYLKNYWETLNDDTLLILCEHKIVNAITNHYRSIAQEKNIDFVIHLAIPEEIAISNTDISILIGNLLENAFEAASQIESASFVHFNMKCCGKMLVITVDNSFNGRVNISNNTYLTTKRNSGGIGLKSIEGIARKYAGEVDFKHENGVFYGSVMLNFFSS